MAGTDTAEISQSGKEEEKTAKRKKDVLIFSVLAFLSPKTSDTNLTKRACEKAFTQPATLSLIACGRVQSLCCSESCIKSTAYSVVAAQRIGITATVCSQNKLFALSTIETIPGHILALIIFLEGNS